MNRQTRMMSRDEVVSAERRAWTEADEGVGRLYVYDGINFWHRQGRCEPQPVAPWRAPRAGWRHREDCRCGGCAS